jgi:quercetin dioxygenase-like cupin family protein
MNADEVQRSKMFRAEDVLQYLPNAIGSRTIIKKTTGSVTALSFDAGEVLNAKVLPFDTLLQVIDGEAEVIIDGNASTLGIGQYIVVPPHTHNSIRAIVRFKMLSTIIKGGYEDVM